MSKLKPVNPKDWTNILEILAQGQLDQNFIAQKLVPLQSSTDICYNIDNLGESLLFYAITYKNNILLTHFLENIDFASFPSKSKKKVKKSVYRAIKQLSYDCHENSEFLEAIIKSIARSSFKPLLTDYVKEGHFAYIFESVLPQHKKSFDFMNTILMCLKEQTLIAENDEQYIELKNIFETIGRTCIWTRYGIKNFMETSSFNLKYLEYEFFHHAAEKGLYNQIDTFNILQDSKFLLKKNSAGENVFLLLFKKAPFEFLQRNLKNLGQVLHASQEKLNQYNNRKQTFLHLLLLNQKLSLNEKVEILKEMNKDFELQDYNKIADHCNMTPLVLFICLFSKQIQENLTNYVPALDLLIPKVSLSETSKSLEHAYAYAVLKNLNLKISKEACEFFEKESKDELIYNQKLIKICLDLRVEALLLNLLQKIPYLNLNSLYNETVGTTRHLICIAAEKNCRLVLKWFLEHNLTQKFCFLILNKLLSENLGQFGYQGFVVNQSQIENYLHYSIFDQIIDLVLNKAAYQSLEEQTKTLLLDLFEKMWNSLPAKEQLKALLNFSFQYKALCIKMRKIASSTESSIKYIPKRLKASILPQIFLTKLLSSENPRLLNFLKPTIQRLQQEKLEDNIRKALVFSALELKLVSFLNDASFQSLFVITEIEPETELSHLYNLLFRSPRALGAVCSFNPQLKTCFLSKTFLLRLGASVLSNEDEKEIVKVLGPLIVDWLLNGNLQIHNQEDRRLHILSTLDKMHSNMISLLEGNLRPKVLLDLSKEIIRILVKMRKVQEVHSKICELAEQFQHKKFLDMCCLAYIHDSEYFQNIPSVMNFREDQSFEEQLAGIYLEKALDSNKEKILVLKHRNLNELKKAGRLRILGWHIELASWEQTFKEIKKQKMRTVEILYLNLFITSSDNYFHDYALELCKTGGKEAEIVKSIYTKLADDGSKNFIKTKALLLYAAIRKLDVVGVERVLDLDIYGADRIENFQSPVYALIGMLESQKGLKGKESIERMNQIMHKILTFYPPEKFNDIFYLKVDIHITGQNRNIFLLFERNLYKYLNDDNFELIQYQDLFNYKLLSSMDGKFYSPIGVYIKNLFERSVITIQKILPKLLEMTEKPESLDDKLFQLSYILLSEEKVSSILILLNNLPEEVHTSRKVIILNWLKYCLQHNKSLLEPIVKALIEKRTRFDMNGIILKEMKIAYPKCYYLLLFSNKFEEKDFQLWATSLLDIDVEDLESVLDLLKSNLEQVASLFCAKELAQVLGFNGCHKKVDKFLNLGNYLLQEFPDKQEIVIQWAQAAFEASCEIQELIMADQAIDPVKSQFNIFRINHILSLKEKDLHQWDWPLKAPIEKPPKYYNYLTYQPNICKKFDSEVKLTAKKIGPLTENKYRLKFSSISSKTILKEETAESQEATKSTANKELQRRYNVYGFEPKNILEPTKKQASRPYQSKSERIKNPFSSRVLFYQYQKSWGHYNIKDEYDPVQTTKNLFSFLSQFQRKNVGEEPSFSSSSEERWEQVLLKGVKASIKTVEASLVKYLESISQSEPKRFTEFYLKLLATSFKQASAAIAYNPGSVLITGVHSTYHKDIECILPLFSYFSKINKGETDLSKKLLTQTIKAIYYYGNLDVSVHFCQALVKSFTDEKLEKEFGISKSKVLGIFLRPAINKKSLAHFHSILQLDPSLNVIDNMETLSENASNQHKNPLNQPTEILPALFQKSLWNFVLEYDKLKGNAQLLQPLEDIENLNSKLTSILKEIPKPLWLHLALLKGAIELVKGYLTKDVFSTKELECTLYSGNYDLFDLVARKVFSNDPAKVFSYIRDNQILLKLITNNPKLEDFTIKIFSAYVLNTKTNLSLGVEYFRQKDKYGWTVFHYVAFNGMTRLFYMLLKYIKDTVCEKKTQAFLDAMQNLLNEPIRNENEGQDKSHEAEVLEQLSPLQLACVMRFNEMTCFANEFKIDIKNPSHVKKRVSAKLKSYLLNNLSDQSQYDRILSLITKDKQNEFSALYIESVRAFLRSIQIMQKCGQKTLRELPGNWIDLIEDIFFTNNYLIADSEELVKRINIKHVRSLQMEIILAKLHPTIILMLKSKAQILHLNPQILTYIISKTYETSKSKMNDHIKNLYANYELEIKNDDSRSNRIVNVFEKAWLDQDLVKSINRIREILRFEEKEAQIFNKAGFLELSEQTVFEMANAYYSKGLMFPLKALILVYPKYFFKELTEQQDDTESYQKLNFWNDLYSNPSFMCNVLSLLDQGTFESLVIQNIEDLLSAYESIQSEENELHKTRSMACCFIYIAFSLRAESKSELFSKNQLPELVTRVMTPLVVNDPLSNKLSISMLIHFIQNLLKYFNNKEISYNKVNAIEKHKQTLLSICSELRGLIKSHITVEADLASEDESITGVSISDEDIDKHLEVCLNFVIKQLKGEENPLLIYTHTIEVTLKLFNIIQELSELSAKHKIIAQLFLKDCIKDPNTIGAQMQKLRENQLKMTVGYTINYNKEGGTFEILWDKRSIDEIEQQIQEFVIMNKVRKIFEKMPKPSNEDPCKKNYFYDFTLDIDPKVPNIDYKSFESASYQEKFKFINSEYYLQNAIPNYFGIKPFATEIEHLLGAANAGKSCAINEVETGHPPLLLNIPSTPNIQLVLHEFYVTFSPKVESFIVRYLKPEQFEDKRKKSTSLDCLLKSLALYEATVVESSQKSDSELKKITLNDVNWFVGGNSLSHLNELPFYDILKLRDMMAKFHEKIAGSFKSDESQLRWELCAKSLLAEIVSNLTQTIRKALIASASFKGEGEPRKKKLIEEYIKREDNVLNTLENYLNSSILRKIISMIMHTFTMELPQMAGLYNGYYVIFENVPKKANDPIDSKDFGLFDRIIRYTKVKLEPAGDVMIIKLQYYVNPLSAKDLEEYTRMCLNSFDIIETNKVVQEYLDTLLTKYDACSQLMEQTKLIDMILDKKVIEEVLGSFSRSISEKIKQRININFDYNKLYTLCKPWLEKVNSSSNPKSECNAIFAKMEHKLILLRNFILNKLPQKIENTVLSENYIGQLATEIFIQNHLYQNKKPLADFLKEKAVSFDTYPTHNPNIMLTQEVPFWEDFKNQKFAFLIQTDRTLTFLNAKPGQQYLILTSVGFRYYIVGANSALPQHEDGHYLLMSTTWPDLDFCGNKIGRVLILAGSRIVDVSDSSNFLLLCHVNLLSGLSTLLNTLQYGNLEEINKLKSFLLNKDFDLNNGVSAHSLFPLYPSLISLNLTSFEPKQEENKQLQKNEETIQIFHDKRTLDIFYINEMKVDMKPLTRDNLRYSHKLQVETVFQATLHDFQSKIRNLLKTIGIKELIDKKRISLPKVLFELSSDLEYSIDIPCDEFSEVINPLLEDIAQVLEKVVCLSQDKAYQLQEIASILFEDIYMENNIVAFRNAVSLCQSVSGIHLLLAREKRDKPLSFDQMRKIVSIAVQVIEEEDQYVLNYPSQYEVAAFLTQILYIEELKRAQSIFTSQNQPNDESRVDILSKLKQVISSKVDITFKFDTVIAEDEIKNNYLYLLLMDMLLWSLTVSTQFLNLRDSQVLTQLKRLEILVINDPQKKAEFEILKASIAKEPQGKVLTLCFNVSASHNNFVFQPYEVYLSLCKQLGLKRTVEPIPRTSVKPLDTLMFTFNENEQTIERKFKIDCEALAYCFGDQDKDSVDLLKSGAIAAEMIGFDDLKNYVCKRIEVVDDENNSDQGTEVLKVLIDKSLPSQNYFMCFIVKENILKPLHMNLYRMDSPIFTAIANVMAHQEGVIRDSTTTAFTDEPYYLITELKNSLELTIGEKALKSCLRISSKKKTLHSKQLDKKNKEVWAMIPVDHSEKAGKKTINKICQVRSKSLDETKIYYKLFASESYILEVGINTNLLTLLGHPDRERFELEFISNPKPVLENTKVIGPSKTIYTNKKMFEKEKVDIASFDPYQCIYQNLVRADSNMNLVHDVNQENFITREEDLETDFIRKFQETNFLTNVQKNEYCSIAGEERVETLEFRTKDGKETLIPSHEVLSYSIIFVHNKCSKISFKGTIFQKGPGKYCVKWKPFIKGSYSLLINGRVVTCASNLIVIAAASFDEACSFKWPKMDSYAYYDKIRFDAAFKDKYGNNLNQVEIDRHHKFQRLLSDQVSSPDVKLDMDSDRVDMNGILTTTIILAPQNADAVLSNSKIALTFLLHSTPVHCMDLQVLGITFIKRVELFYSDVEKYQRRSVNYLGQNIKVRREKLFKDLLAHPLKRFKKVLSVKLLNEPEKDPDALKREFWRLVGEEFKNTNNRIFSHLDDKYFLSYDYILTEKTEKSLKLYGALLAGSILNAQLIGVNFASPFRKALFGDKLELEDLKEVFGEHASKNYLSLLEMSEKDLNGLDRYFVIKVRNKQYELIPDGAKLKVTSQNVKEYLEHVVEFYFITYHTRALELIKEGFTQVFPLPELKKWVGYSELPLLTYGDLNINAEKVLKVLNYIEASNTQIQFFTQFIKEADADAKLLRGLLKFVTGSSALPYDDPDYSINISFRNTEKDQQPIAETHSKYLELPKCKTFEDMQKILTSAFKNIN